MEYTFDFIAQPLCFPVAAPAGGQTIPAVFRAAWSAGLNAGSEKPSTYSPSERTSQSLKPAPRGNFLQMAHVTQSHRAYPLRAHHAVRDHRRLYNVRPVRV